MSKNFPFLYSNFGNLFLSPLFPKKGEEVRISIVSSSKMDSLFLKYDSQTGLVFQTNMYYDGLYNGLYRYSAKVETNLDDELFHYYFAFFLDEKSYYYSRKGITRYVPNFQDRFSLMLSIDYPEWVSSSTCYQIFPDRFCNMDNSCGAKEGEYEFDGGLVTTPKWTDEPKEWNESRCCDFYNGDLKGIEEKVSYFKSLGINTLYINPIFSSRSVHRYDTVDFFSVDEKLGGNEALKKMVETLHKNGIRVILDISINHQGLDSLWLKKALENKDSKERGFFYFNLDGSLGCWQNVRTLPQLNYNSQELRDLMYRNKDSVMKKFILPPYSIDGWRLDVAPEVARRGKDELCLEVWREVNKNLKGVKKDLYLVGEDWDDSSLYTSGDMWDGTMNYYGCGRILRSWMGERDRFLSKEWGHSPEREEAWSAEDVVSALEEALSDLALQRPYFEMNLFDSHDTPRLHNHSDIFNRDIYKGVVIAQYLLPGMPSLYYGDEVLLMGRLGSNEGARYPMEWREEKRDKDMLNFYSLLGKIRNEYLKGFESYYICALDSLAFAIIRFDFDRAICAIINRGEEREVTLLPYLLPLNKIKVILGDGSIEKESDKIKVRLCSKKSLIISFN